MNINDMLSDIMKRPAPTVAPATALADIPGWDSVVMVRLMLSLEEKLGRELAESEIEAIVTVADVKRLIGQV